MTFTDPTVSEALSYAVDFLFIDAEHSPHTPEVVQAHVMATKGARCASIVRVPTGDAGFVKLALDAGADGIIAPQARSAAEVRHMVSSCRYPPLGIRGFGPRRSAGYGQYAGGDYPQRANSEVMAFVMMEHVNAVKELDEILAIPGLDGVVIGPADLSGSLGRLLDISHPDVQRLLDTIISKTRAAGRMLGVGMGDNPEEAKGWIKRGVQFLQVGSDYGYLIGATRRIGEAIRAG